MAGSPSDLSAAAKRMTFRRAARVIGVTLTLAAFASCAQPNDRPLVERARNVTAMVALADGGLLYGERTTGRILDLDGELIARVDVVSEGQRGLLGLAVDDDGSIFASWTRPDGRLVVGAVAPRRRTVWLGPRSTDLATGGHIAIDPDYSSLVVGIGDLQDPGAVSDVDAPNGKLLRLDPDGRPDQKPETVSYGWNNPYAFDFADDGALWLADNAPGTQEERLLRADPVGPRAVLPARTAPSGLAVVDESTLVVCGYRTKRLLLYRVGPNGVPQLDGTLARDCRLGVVALSDGRVAYSTGRSIKTVRA